MLFLYINYILNKKMKTLNTYINESTLNNDLLFESVLELHENTTLQDVYESLFDKLYSENTINEGLFSKIGATLKKIGDKASAKGEEIDQKINNLSDAGKAAIETAKKKAGNTWDDVKGVYTNAVSAIDNAISASKDTITNMAEKFKIKKDQLEATVANVYANAIAKGGEFGKKAQEWVANAAKYPAQIAACVAIITGAKMATVAGYDSSMIIDLLASAGIK